MVKETRKLSELKNWEKNPRSINKKDFERLKKQITKLGQYKPLIVTSDGTVLGGNMRLKAYQELDVKEVWVSVVDAPTEEKKLEFALSDNDRAGYYDSDLLANMIPEYPDFDWGNYAVDLRAPQTLDDLFPEDAIEDEAPAVADGEPISMYGEVYQLGRHKLMCGDATNMEDMEKLMDGQKADMVLTDPPYGMDLDTDYTGMKVAFGGRDIGGNKYEKVIGDNIDYDPKVIFDNFGYCKEIFLWGADYYAERIPKRNDGSWVVWDKMGGSEGPNDQYEKMYGSNFELVWSKAKHKRALVRILWKSFFGTQKEDTKKRVHPTQKPIELATWFYKKFSKENDIIVDLYGGSGSFLIACEQTNRTCYMMELDPKYCDVIRKRYENFVHNNK